MVACAGVGELSEAEDGLFGNPDVGRPGEGTVVLGRPIRFGLGDVKAVLDGVKPGKEGLLRPGSNTGGMPWSAGYVVGRLRA